VPRLTSLRKQIVGKDIRDRIANRMLSYLDRDVHSRVIIMVHDKMQSDVSVVFELSSIISDKVYRHEIEIS
jgi:hypothetical protein